MAGKPLKIIISYLITILYHKIDVHVNQGDEASRCEEENKDEDPNHQIDVNVDQDDEANGGEEENEDEETSSFVFSFYQHLH